MTIQKRLANGETVYLRQGFEDAIIKLTPSERGTIAEVKFRGEKPYEVSTSAVIVTDATLENDQTTEEEYLAF